MSLNLTDPVLIAALIGAAGTIGGALVGNRRGRRQKEDKIRDAPRRYAEHLDELINRASVISSADIVKHGRTIVATRNDMRISVTAIASLLNSEFDRLDVELKSPTSRYDIYETVQVLALKWPAKKAQLEGEIARLLGELGINERD